MKYSLSPVEPLRQKEEKCCGSAETFSSALTVSDSFSVKEDKGQVCACPACIEFPSKPRFPVLI